MAKVVGKITKITNNLFQIDGKGSLNYKGNDKFKVGDVIEFHEKNGNIRDAKPYVKKDEKIDESFSQTNAYVCNRRQPRIEWLYEIASLLDVETKNLLVNNQEIKK
jgi:hypothetical protein